jgi:hypothetical protein
MYGTVFAYYIQANSDQHSIYRSRSIYTINRGKWTFKHSCLNSNDTSNSKYRKPSWETGRTIRIKTALRTVNNNQRSQLQRHSTHQHVFSIAALMTSYVRYATKLTSKSSFNIRFKKVPWWTKRSYIGMIPLTTSQCWPTAQSVLPGSTFPTGTSGGATQYDQLLAVVGIGGSGGGVRVDDSAAVWTIAWMAVWVGDEDSSRLFRRLTKLQSIGLSAGSLSGNKVIIDYTTNPLFFIYHYRPRTPHQNHNWKQGPSSANDKRTQPLSSLTNDHAG